MTSFSATPHPRLVYAWEGEVESLRDEIKHLREFVAWVDSFVSNSANAYSVDVIDGLFGITRDKIAALTQVNAMTETHLAEDGPWTECWQCGGCGQVAGCFEDTCSGADCDPEDPEYCCCPSRCDVCKGKGGWDTLTTAKESE